HGSKCPSSSRSNKSLHEKLPTKGMNPLRVIVVDDEQLAREELCYQLEQMPSIEIVAQAVNGIDALPAVERHGPDLVFLDIQMPGLGGFEVARRLLERD